MWKITYQEYDEVHIEIIPYVYKNKLDLKKYYKIKYPNRRIIYCELYNNSKNLNKLINKYKQNSWKL
jgi:uncharacterized protein YlbG (UPF0298 family)